MGRGTSITGGFIFIMALLIIAVYFVGVSTDARAFAAASSNIINSLTGRDAQGNFGSYPGGATLPAGVTVP